MSWLPRFVRDYQWQNLTILQQYGPMILIEHHQPLQQQQQSTLQQPLHQIKEPIFDIIYQMNPSATTTTTTTTTLGLINTTTTNVINNNQDVNILWQTNNRNDAIERFNYLERILNVTFSKSMLTKTRCIRFIMNQLIPLMIDHPNWLDIHIAAFFGLTDYFKKYSFTPNQINIQREPDNFTPLHLAIMRQYDSIVDRIAQNKPDLTRMDFEGNTPLHLAAMLPNNLKIFKITTSLLQSLSTTIEYKNYVLQLKNRSGLTPIDIIARNLRKDYFVHLMKQIGLTARMLTIIIVRSESDHQFLKMVDNEKIIPFTDSDISDIDFQRIDLGGCPLHWITQTPLIMAIKTNNFNCSLCLLLNDANANHSDLNGDLTLHHAVRLSNQLLVKLLLIFDANINHRNRTEQLDPYQLATKRQDQQMVKLLDSYMEARQQSIIIDDDDDNDQNSIRNLTMDVEQQKCCHYLNISKKNRKGLIDQSTSPGKKKKGKKSRLICFDGGGIKGLFTIQILIELEKCLIQKQQQRNRQQQKPGQPGQQQNKNNRENREKKPEKKLSDYFDWIAGTSTGSIIAYWFSQRKSLTGLRLLYFHFKDNVFHGNRPYSTEKLETLLKTKLSEANNINQTVGDIWNESGKHLIISASRVDCFPPRLQLFCSHHRFTGSKNKILIWQALRASSAAPTYFQHYLPYIDGGLMSNNPTLDALTEYFRYQQHGGQENLDMVLSIGCGFLQQNEMKKNFSAAFDKFNYFLDFRSFVNDFSYRLHHHQPWTYGNELASHMKSQVTNCNDHIVLRSLTWCSCLNITFGRLNTLLSKKIPLDESRNDELILGLWDVKLFLFKQLNYFNKIIDILLLDDDDDDDDDQQDQDKDQQENQQDDDYQDLNIDKILQQQQQQQEPEPKQQEPEPKQQQQPEPILGQYDDDNDIFHDTHN
ncbi:hypothetical protein DERP_014612 [Dermatophagoides pteronyssinus]|uniref:phospholipase A2 n=1 Tax=Dermatophagoides pteronyssinus TaxID=6956 RepID=A0ABQ8IVW0_DERPT|nr:hypothetical protein DERP_014612 [Dermatophagoides pteronyssinus]